MLQQIRQTIVQALWQRYRQRLPEIEMIAAGLKAKDVAILPLDHFAVIDLPGRYTGIPQLAEIFSALGFVKRGQGYLPDKQNEFFWLAETNAETKLATEALPQIVVADFHLDEMPVEIKKIIEKYAAFASAPPLSELNALGTGATCCARTQQQLCELIVNYFSGRDWPLPTLTEFKTVQAFNELLAWVLIFGRQPNHFTVAVHLLSKFENLAAFNQFLVNDLQLVLNEQGGVIKGGHAVGIAQSAVTGGQVFVKLADGEIKLPQFFIEFVWRYPKNNSSSSPLSWNEYFTDFVAENADDVVESLYVN